MATILNSLVGMTVRRLLPPVVAATAMHEVVRNEKSKEMKGIQRHMTAIGRFSVLSQTEYNPSIITFFLELSGEPMTARDIQKLWMDREMKKLHPRFHQVVTDKLQFADEPDDTKHITDTVFPANRDDLRMRIAQYIMQPWDLSNSLWFMEASHTSNRNLILFRGHHALADGASMGASFLDLVDEAQVLKDIVISKIKALYKKRTNTSRTLLETWWRLWVKLVHFVFNSLWAILHQGRLVVLKLFDSDPWKLLKTKESSTRRTLAWSKVASLDQAKWVAESLGGGTINDLFVACVTGALSKQLEYHRITNPDLPVQNQMHIAVPVHLKGGVVLPNESVGNNLGAFVARLPGEHVPPQSRLVQTRQELDSIKRTPIALYSHLLARCLSSMTAIVPSAWMAHLYGRANIGSVAVVSNNRGAPMKIHMEGRPVEGMYGFVPLPPGIPVGITVTSYNNQLCCTLTAEPWAVPDGDRFMEWILDEYLELARLAKEEKKQPYRSLNE